MKNASTVDVIMVICMMLLCLGFIGTVIIAVKDAANKEVVFNCSSESRITRLIEENEFIIELYVCEDYMVPSSDPDDVGFDRQTTCHYKKTAGPFSSFSQAKEICLR